MLSIVQLAVLPQDSMIHDLQFFIYGFLGVLAGLLNLYLPETSGRSMPQTMDDLIARLVDGSGSREISVRLSHLARKGVLPFSYEDDADGEEGAAMVANTTFDDDDDEEEDVDVFDRRKRDEVFHAVPL